MSIYGPTIINICGAETGNTSELLSSTSTTIVASSFVRTGKYCFKQAVTSLSSSAARFAGYDSLGRHVVFNQPVTFARFYFQHRTNIATNNEPIFDCRNGTSNLIKFEMRLNNSNKLVIFSSGGTNAIATGTTTITPSSWHMIETKIGTGSTNGEYQILVDGEQEFRGYANLMDTNAGYIQLGKTTNRNSNNIEYYFDDIAISNDGFIGSGHVYCMPPYIDGDYAEWMTSGVGPVTFNTDCVSERPNDGESTYLYSTTANTAFTVIGSGTSVVGVKPIIAAIKPIALLRDTSGTSRVNLYVISNGSGLKTANLDLGTSYTPYATILETDHGRGGIKWSLSALDELQYGVFHGLTIETRCTQTMLMVESKDRYSFKSLTGVGK